ncbi:MAG: fibrobacter succinogenes major paralogous domain-containing protein [Muribaculaceae bacterium]|nr:fibrobacter succinogenes major paralogous domain-containing protein [Muribaculaceae bacterium]
MKKMIYSLLALPLLIMSSCSEDKFNDVEPVATGTVTDAEGNVYNWVQIGDQQWTTTNAMGGEPVGEMSYVNNLGYTYDVFSESKAENLEKEYYPVYGNLMSIEDALESAPEGWRLPTDEDWNRLERAYGVKNPQDKGMQASGIASKMMNPDGLNLLLGGAILVGKSYGSENYRLLRVNSMGYYWTATEDTSREDVDNKYYYYRRIDSYTGSIDRESMVTRVRFSVRWVRDAK